MKKYFNKIILVFVFILSSFVLSGYFTREEVNGDLIIATEAGFAPYEYYSNGEITGVDIDIAREIAKYLNRNLVVKDVAFDSIINEVKSGKSDLGIAGISYSPERSLEVDFSVNYATSEQVIIVKNDSKIKKPSDLYGRVAVQLGSISDTYLTENYSDIEIVREKKNLAAIQDLRDGKVNAVVMDKIPAKKLLDRDMIILNDSLTSDSYGIVVKKGNEELLNAVNTVINRMVKNGDIDKLIIKHMAVEEKSEQSNIFDKFYYSVIYDGRYKYILEGLYNTVIMAVLAIIVGVVLGVILSVIRNYHDNTGKIKILNSIAKLYITVIRGTPSILQLMIIYYVIFSSVSINILFVGVLAFGLNSAAYVAEIIRSGFNSIDKGQIEAGYALGLSYKTVIKNIVFPQAIKNVLPALLNEFITLVKETAVGAYIGIMELTKASDIIASRTYDYFFPLILIALIYLLITYLLSKLVNKVEVKINATRS